MSKILEANITCPYCGHSFDVKVYRSIWGEYPENRHLVFSDQINAETCPSCDLRMKLPCPLFYTNADQRFAVWYEPTHDPVVDEDVRAYDAMGSRFDYLASAPRVRDWEAFKNTIRKFEEGRRRTNQDTSAPERKSILGRLADAVRPKKRMLAVVSAPAPQASPTALDLVEDAERRYAHDPKRLHQLSLLRERLDQDIRLKGKQPPPEIIAPLLELVDRGVLPPPGVVSSIVAAVDKAKATDVKDRRTLLDREVDFLYQYTVEHHDGVDPVAFYAVVNSIARGVILAVRVEDERLDELLPSAGTVVDPITGLADVQTNEFLAYLATQEFRIFVDRRVNQVESEIYSRLLNAYLSRVNITEELDASEALFLIKLTTIVKHAFLFGLWFGVMFPTKAQALLVELQEGPVVHREPIQLRTEEPDMNEGLDSFLIGMLRDATERAATGETGIESDPKLAFVIGPATAYLRIGPQRDRRILESAFGVRGGVWSEPQLRKYRRAVVRVLRENPTNETYRKHLLEKFPVIRGSEIDVPVSKDVRAVVLKMLGIR